MPKTNTQFTLEDIYNMIMLDIEPDLATFNIDSLDTKYADESKDERAKRIKRYISAFKKCSEKFSVCMHLWKKALLKIRSSAMVEGSNIKDLEELEKQIFDDTQHA